MNVEPLDPKLGGNAQDVDEDLIFCHIVCGVEMKSDHVKLSISLGSLGLAIVVFLSIPPRNPPILGILLLFRGRMLCRSP
jgi:hypothetical protein